MFNFFPSNNSLVDATTLHNLLDDILTPKLEKFGLIKAGNYLWHEQNSKEIRGGFSYNLLKGGIGTFTWGVNLNFLPTIANNNNIVYHRPSKKYMHHLFEWPDEYSHSFATGEIVNGVTTHFGMKEARKSIIELYQRNESKIVEWFGVANTVENLINITERQIKVGKHYDIHYPNPKFVLAFLYAKTGHIDEAKKLFDTLSRSYFGNNEEAREMLEAKLVTLVDDSI